MLLKNHQLFVLFSIKKSRSKTFADIRQAYADLLRDIPFMKAYSFSTMYQDIKCLENLYLIKKEHELGTRELKFKITFTNNDIIDEEVDTRTKNIQLK